MGSAGPILKLVKLRLPFRFEVIVAAGVDFGRVAVAFCRAIFGVVFGGQETSKTLFFHMFHKIIALLLAHSIAFQIGRASCRERV